MYIHFCHSIFFLITLLPLSFSFSFFFPLSLKKTYTIALTEFLCCVLPFLNDHTQSMSSKEDDDLARAIEASIRDMELNTTQKLRLDGVNRHPKDSSLIEIKSESISRCRVKRRYRRSSLSYPIYIILNHCTSHNKDHTQLPYIITRHIQLNH